MQNFYIYILTEMTITLIKINICVNSKQISLCIFAFMWNGCSGTPQRSWWFVDIFLHQLSGQKLAVEFPSSSEQINTSALFLPADAVIQPSQTTNASLMFYTTSGATQKTKGYCDRQLHIASVRLQLAWLRKRLATLADVKRRHGGDTLQMDELHDR